jgi:hypothetical protein
VSAVAARRTPHAYGSEAYAAARQWLPVKRMVSWVACRRWVHAPASPPHAARSGRVQRLLVFSLPCAGTLP